MAARTIQTTADAKPLLKKLNSDPKARDAYKEEISGGRLIHAALKADATADLFYNLSGAKRKAKAPSAAVLNVCVRAKIANVPSIRT